MGFNSAFKGLKEHDRLLVGAMSMQSQFHLSNGMTGMPMTEISAELLNIHVSSVIKTTAKRLEKRTGY
jgi:hypothetical protein